jgi:hypothetical protein
MKLKLLLIDRISVMGKWDEFSEENDATFETLIGIGCARQTAANR